MRRRGGRANLPSGRCDALVEWWSGRSRGASPESSGAADASAVLPGAGSPASRVVPVAPSRPPKTTAWVADVVGRRTPTSASDAPAFKKNNEDFPLPRVTPANTTTVYSPDNRSRLPARWSRCAQAVEDVLGQPAGSEGGPRGQGAARRSTSVSCSTVAMRSAAARDSSPDTTAEAAPSTSPYRAASWHPGTMDCERGVRPAACLASPRTAYSKVATSPIRAGHCGASGNRDLWAPVSSLCVWLRRRQA